MALLCICDSHKNNVVRDAASRLMASIAEALGPGRVLSGIKDITDRMLCTAAQLMLDSSADTRYCHIAMWPLRELGFNTFF